MDHLQNHVSIYKYVAICKNTVLRLIRALVHRTHKRSCVDATRAGVSVSPDMRRRCPACRCVTH
jgi:hypothetical protein